MTGTASKVNQTSDGLRVQGLDFAYAQAIVLQDITFTLRQGSVGLLGPNGSGKTTLLRALLGHLPLPREKVNVLGWDMAVNPRAARQRIGWMPERGGIIPGMSGVAMVAYLGELSGMPERDAMQRAHEVMDYVALGEARYRKCEDYSQGMRQRLKLAQALVHDPAWIFLDEPTSGLDPKGRVAILKLIHDLASNKGFGVILSTHLLPDVEAVCQEILVLREGQLLSHDVIDNQATTARQVFEVEGFGEEELFQARLREQGVEITKDGRLTLITVGSGEGAEMILAAAEATGYALRRLRRQRLSLADVFYKLVEE